MKIQRVYIDTSVIGGCFDPEFAVWSNGLMHDFEVGTFKSVVSEVVAAEVAAAPDLVRERYTALLRLDTEVLEIGDAALDLVTAYQQHEILGANYRNDMLHIALATVAEVDILVSWNFSHIVRFDKIRMFNAVNSELGYKRLEIYSPQEVTTYGRDQGT